MVQRYRLLQALRDAGDAGLSSWDAVHNLQILRAGARLQELRNEGYIIETVQQPNAPDGTRRFRYFLRAEPETAFTTSHSGETGPSQPGRPAEAPQLFNTPTPRRSAVTGRDVQEAA